MKTLIRILFLVSGLFYSSLSLADRTANAPMVVHFSSGKLKLGGELFKPAGDGPFPVLIYNHGSAPGMLNSQASKAIAPLFVEKGWAFFMPYRRGQGLSSAAGKFIGDEIEAARKEGGLTEASATMVRLLQDDHLSDQLAAVAWIKTQKFIDTKKIAVAGNSFGGIETVLGVAREPYCAAVAAAAGAESWSVSPELQLIMKKAVVAAKTPIYFFQAENDFDLSPSRTLHSEMKAAGKISEIKIYPAFGRSAKDGHSFAYLELVRS